MTRLVLLFLQRFLADKNEKGAKKKFMRKRNKKREGEREREEEKEMAVKCCCRSQNTRVDV